MDTQLLIRRLIEKDLVRCEKLYLELNAELEILPRGSLIKRKNGSTSVSIREGGRQYQIVISPENEEMIFQLKKRRFIKSGLPKLKSWISACKAFLDKCCIYDPVAIEKSLPVQYEGLEGLDIFLEGDINPKDWENYLVEESIFFAGNLIHQTPGGVKMRSKSEVMIGTQLEHRGIPYHYEVEIKCTGGKHSADFELLHPVLRRRIYLEHLGMIDDPIYVMRNLEKLKDYAREGIVLGYNLFITYETKQTPLTITAINKVIDEIMALA